jgi:hypothetical protein
MQVKTSLQPTGEHRKFRGSLGDLATLLLTENLAVHETLRVCYHLSRRYRVVEISLFLFVDATMTKVALNRPVKFNYRMKVISMRAFDPRRS